MSQTSTNVFQPDDFKPGRTHLRVFHSSTTDFPVVCRFSLLQVDTRWPDFCSYEKPPVPYLINFLTTFEISKLATSHSKRTMIIQLIHLHAKPRNSMQPTSTAQHTVVLSRHQMYMFSHEEQHIKKSWFGKSVDSSRCQTNLCWYFLSISILLSA